MAFHHCVLGKSWVWLFLLGLAPFAFWFCFSLLVGEAHIWLGDLRFASCGWCLCFVCAFDLPSYMTTGVYVDVILTASSHVRTEPQSVIGHTRGKKKSTKRSTKWFAGFFLRSKHQPTNLPCCSRCRATLSAVAILRVAIAGSGWGIVLQLRFWFGAMSTAS